MVHEFDVSDMSLTEVLRTGAETVVASLEEYAAIV